MPKLPFVYRQTLLRDRHAYLLGEAAAVWQEIVRLEQLGTIHKVAPPPEPGRIEHQYDRKSMEPCA